MPKGTCSEEGCERPAKARGWCNTHYSRWRIHGSPTLQQRPTLAERFWSKVDCSGGPDACWPWTASLGSWGYGQFHIGGHDGPPSRAHRVAWELVHGPVPEGFSVLHHCDNPPCCNPYRCLFLGTHADNMADMVSKGRSPRGGGPGECNGQAKLTENGVVEIRRRYAQGGVLQRELAAEFGVSRPTISDIIAHRRWRHVADDG